MSSSIAIIPARMGSKRIPGKNIRPFLGKPIIGYSIETAIHSELFDEVMVSTDSEEIAEISRKLGAGVPFLRSPGTSDDFSGLAEVITEVVDSYAVLGKTFDFICCILPTSPLLRVKHLVEGFGLLTKHNFDSVFPVLRFSYPILRSLKMTNGRFEMNWSQYLNSRSQDLEPAFHDAGQFYWLRTESFLEQKRIFTNNSGGFELSEMEAHDIDTESDWLLAEIKYKILNDERKDSPNKG